MWSLKWLWRYEVKNNQLRGFTCYTCQAWYCLVCSGTPPEVNRWARQVEPRFFKQMTGKESVSVSYVRELPPSVKRENERNAGACNQYRFFHIFCWVCFEMGLVKWVKNTHLTKQWCTWTWNSKIFYFFLIYIYIIVEDNKSDLKINVYLKSVDLILFQMLYDAALQSKDCLLLPSSLQLFHFKLPQISIKSHPISRWWILKYQLPSFIQFLSLWSH